MKILCFTDIIFRVLVLSLFILLPSIASSNILEFECGIYKFGELIVVKSHTAHISLDIQTKSATFASSISSTRNVRGKVFSADKNMIVVDFTESNIAAYFYHFKKTNSLDDIIDILDNFDRRPVQRARALGFMQEVYTGMDIKIDSILQIRLEKYNPRIWKRETKDIFYVLDCKQQLRH